MFIIYFFYSIRLFVTIFLIHTVISSVTVFIFLCTADSNYSPYFDAQFGAFCLFELSFRDVCYRPFVGKTTFRYEFIAITTVALLQNRYYREKNLTRWAMSSNESAEIKKMPIGISHNIKTMVFKSRWKSDKSICVLFLWPISWVMDKITLETPQASHILPVSRNK